MRLMREATMAEVERDPIDTPKKKKYAGMTRRSLVFGIGGAAVLMG